MAKRCLTLVTIFACLAGCSSKGVYQGIYEGVRAKNQMDASPSERLGKPELPMDYQQYDNMRLKRSD